MVICFLWSISFTSRILSFLGRNERVLISREEMFYEFQLQNSREGWEGREGGSCEQDTDDHVGHYHGQKVTSCYQVFLKVMMMAVVL